MNELEKLKVLASLAKMSAKGDDNLNIFIDNAELELSIILESYTGVTK